MTLLEVSGLNVTFGGDTAVDPVVDNVSFSVERGERVAIIGESGSGKTLTALSVLGLAPLAATVTGSVVFDGEELLGRSDRAMSQIRGDDLTMVFQNPQTSLNPLMRIGAQVAEPLRRHQGMSKQAARRAAIELCARVGMSEPERIAGSYPHQLSGGQRQRIGIAIALACHPVLLIADEPTSALDVTVQAEVLAVLADLVTAERTSLLFITHDLAVVPEVADRVLVMRNGRIVEHGDVATVTTAPTDGYTRQLLAAARKTAL